MKLPISKLNYPSQPLSDDTFVVVDKEISPNTWQSYKVKLSDIKTFIGQEQIYFLITENDEEEMFDEQPIITEDDDNITCVL
jgi:hypothetical protein